MRPEHDSQASSSIRGETGRSEYLETFASEAAALFPTALVPHRATTPCVHPSLGHLPSSGWQAAAADGLKNLTVQEAMQRSRTLAKRLRDAHTAFAELLYTLLAVERRPCCSAIFLQRRGAWMLERVRNDVGAPLASSARLSDSCVHVHAISHVPYLARGSVLAHSHKRHGTRSAIRKQHSLQYSKTAATRYKLRACNVAIALERGHFGSQLHPRTPRTRARYYRLVARAESSCARAKILAAGPRPARAAARTGTMIQLAPRTPYTALAMLCV